MEVTELLTNFLKQKIYAVLLVVVGVTALITYFAWRGGGESNVTVVATGKDTPEELIVVDIAGAVANPGVYKLPQGSRVVDVLRESGGALEGVSASWILKNLNLSAKLVDSQKLYIPFEWDLESLESTVSPLVLQQSVGFDESTAVEEEPTANSGVNLNTATSAELEELPRIGPVTAEKIIAVRPYLNFADFRSKVKISDNVAAEIEPLITF